MSFISQGSNFCWFTTQEWQQSVFDEKRERGFDEPLVYILKFKQKLGEMLTIANHLPTPGVVCLQLKLCYKSFDRRKIKDSFIFHLCFTVF